MDEKIEVVHFQRKQRKEGNFSLEFIFEEMRYHLRHKVHFRIVHAHHFSNGIRKRIANTIQAFRAQGEINHVTGDIHYVNLLFKKNRCILTVLDCGFMNTGNTFARAFYKLFWLTLPEKKSKYITAISEATKSEIIKYTGCDHDKVLVIPVAVSNTYVPSPKIFNSDRPILLQIGTSPNKNVARLAAAIKDIKCELVIIGKINDELREILGKHKIDYVNKVNLSREELYREYVNCDIVTFISTFEGFGMPIIEANCVERVVITGNTSSMPEVGGDAACYVNPFSVDEIQHGLERIMKDEDYRTQLLDNGRLNRARFKSDLIAEMYYNLYQTILKSE